MNSKFETAVLFNKNRDILLDKRGAATSVSFSHTECTLMKDCILTHNHPRGWKAKANSLGRIGNSFSPADLYLAVGNDVSEIRAVTPLYTFVMKRPAKGWGVSRSVVEKEIKKMQKDIIDEFTAVIRKTRADSSVERAQALTYHVLAKRISKKYGWNYSKSKTK